MNLGYCGLDRTREPLRGDEIRACWESRPAAPGGADEAGGANVAGTDDAAILPSPVGPGNGRARLSVPAEVRLFADPNR